MIDLHVHSTFSDGTYSPTELVEIAKDIGLKAISVTDHDTVDGTSEALLAGARAGLQVISGVELSVFLDDIHFHLLGYKFNHQDSRLLGGLSVLQESRKKRNSKIIANLQAMGLDVSDEELQAISGNGQTGRPHIARLMVQKKIVKSIDQAFALYLKKGKKGYVSRFIYHVEEAITLIHASGGFVVLAHPVQISRSIDVLDNLLPRLKKIGLDGVETFYPTQKGKFHRKLRRLAQSCNLFETGGSDYHGNIRPGTSLAGHKNHPVPFELLTLMEQYRLINTPN